LVDRRVAAQLADTNRFGVQRELSSNCVVLRCLSFQKSGNGYETQGKSNVSSRRAFQSDYDDIKPFVTRTVSPRRLTHLQTLPLQWLLDCVDCCPQRLPDQTLEFKNRCLELAERIRSATKAGDHYWWRAM
jgi:hypothetical protein